MLKTYNVFFLLVAVLFCNFNLQSLAKERSVPKGKFQMIRQKSELPIETMTLQNGRFEQDVYVRIYEDITPAIVSIEADLPDGLSSGTGC
ncbi:hypothetical protein tpqmel_0141 [Candidatus Gastranaerophilus sp. (ex Termes propinquus)]|nr:hypothetical protein tpqmel_0141 [Candidatus Gastranaerophilus sp. (ex Termes propinquus)]